MEAVSGRRWSGLDDVLADPLKLSFFLEFLKTQHADESLAFMCDVDKAVAAEDEARWRALEEVCRTYVHDDSPRQVGLSALLQQRLEAAERERHETELVTALRLGKEEVAALLEMDKLSSFCASAFFEVLKRGVATRAAVMDGEVVERFLRLATTEGEWQPAPSRHAETHVARLRDEGGRAGLVQRESLFFPGAAAAPLAQMLFDDERHHPHYYPPCLAGHTLQHFGPDFKAVQTLYKTKARRFSFVVFF